MLKLSESFSVKCCAVSQSPEFLLLSPLVIFINPIYNNKKILKGYDIMSGFECPYCSNVMAISNGTYTEYDINFNSNVNAYYGNVLPEGAIIPESCLKISFYRCPSCNQYTIKAKGIGSEVKDVDTFIRPQSLFKHFPEYIPQTIRQDYEEACAIITLSPKASATLSRRCLQGMIRDFGKLMNQLFTKKLMH